MRAIERSDPPQQGRPRRRYYRLTSHGAQPAYAALARVRTPEPLLARLRPGLAELTDTSNEPSTWLALAWEELAFVGKR